MAGAPRPDHTGSCDSIHLGSQPGPAAGKCLHSTGPGGALPGPITGGRCRQPGLRTGTAVEPQSQLLAATQFVNARAAQRLTSPGGLRLQLALEVVIPVQVASRCPGRLAEATLSVLK